MELEEESLLGLPSAVVVVVVVGGGFVAAVVVVGGSAPQSLSSDGEQVCAIEMMLSALLILSRHRLTTAVQPV